MSAPLRSERGAVAASVARHMPQRPRQAPWEKPRSCHLAGGDVCSSTRASTLSKLWNAEESQGSLVSGEAVKGSGYQALPAAAGARKAKPGRSSSGARS